MLSDTVWNSVFYKLVKTLNLLIHDTILLKKGVDDVPLVILGDLGLSCLRI